MSSAAKTLPGFTCMYLVMAHVLSHAEIAVYIYLALFTYYTCPQPRKHACLYLLGLSLLTTHVLSHADIAVFQWFITGTFTSWYTLSGTTHHRLITGWGASAPTVMPHFSSVRLTFPVFCNSMVITA